MKFIPQAIPEVLLIEPKVHGDQRGYFVETFRHDLFEAATGYPVHFVQDNESSSGRGVLRGLHFQLGKRQRISTYNLECNRFKLTPSNSMYGVQNDQPKTPRQLAADYYPVAAI